MLPVILSILVVLIVVLLVLIVLQPNEVRYTRSTTVNAPASAVFPLINDFHKWTDWSPWEKLDPNTRKMYGGPDSGVGSTYAWEGNKNVGSGHMKILESHPHMLVRIALEFLKPIKGSNITDFTFEEKNGTTVVTQTMSGPNSLMGKVMGLIMDMDKKMIGPNFEKGLADIKAIAEGAAK
ncbi:MAG: polyketide cyclase / dehydrase and lipid transport [Candidatus Peribacteria bacterium]|nr:polyketide cyclase / dehydrase and lipid transport [Candidatus Peribacteria bacterium]